MSFRTFRDDNEYIIRLNRLNEALSKFMKVCEDGFECTDELEEVMLSSYSMLKYIQQYMNKLKIKFDHGYKIKNLSKAIENVLRIQMQWGELKAYPLPDEAAAMECVSRAAYGCLKILGRIE